MPGNSIEAADEMLAVNDPGEVGREHHIFGDRLMVAIGNVFAWLFPLLMAAIVTQVVIRRLGYNQAWLDEAQWWMYGSAMLGGFGYAVTTESHVRVDIFHQNFSQQKKSRIEVFALGWMLIPFMVLMTDVLIHYAIASWRTWEGSDAPNGLHMLFLLKTLLPILSGAAIFAGFAALLRHLKRWKAVTPLWLGIGALPSLWFIAERLIFYAMHFVVSLQNPDLSARKISRLPIMENTIWYGLARALLALAFFHLRAQRSQKVG